MNNADNREKLLYLESLRGLAALIVAIFHAQFLQGSFVTESFIRYGFLMVDFFFVLSGFVIAYSYYDKIHSLKNIWIFQAKRFLRLYPLHFMMLIIFVGVECAKYIFEIKAGIVANNPAFSKNDWGAFFNNLFLTHSLFEEEGTFNEPSWSISAEFYTYLIFAFIMLIQFSFTRVISLIAIIILSGTYGLWSPLIPINIPEMAADFARCIYCFFIGVMVFLFVRHKPFLLPSIFGYLAILACFATLPLRPYLPNSIIPLFFAFTIFALYLSKPNRAQSILEIRPLVFLGTISYGVYMIHELVWWVINNGMRHGLKIPTQLHEPSGKMIIILSDIQIYGIVCTGIMMTILLSWLSYRFLEMPINQYRNKLKIK